MPVPSKPNLSLVAVWMVRNNAGGEGVEPKLVCYTCVLTLLKCSQD